MIHPSEEILLGCSRPSSLTPPRSPFTSDHGPLIPSLSNTDGVKLWGSLFKEISRLPIKDKKAKGYFEFSPSNENQIKFELNAVDFKIEKNIIDDKEIDNKAEVMLKRNKSFEFDLYFNHPFDFTQHNVEVILEKENAKKDDDRERFVMKLCDVNDISDKNWSKEVSVSEYTVSIKTKLSPLATCGSWRIIITVLLSTDIDKSSNVVYTVPGIYIVE